MKTEKPKAKVFTEVFWNPLALMTMLAVAVFVFAMAAGNAHTDGTFVSGHSYPKAGFLASMTVIGILAGIGAATSQYAVSQFVRTRLLDFNTLYVVGMILAILIGVIINIDLNQFKDAAVEAYSVSIPSGIGAMIANYIPTGGKGDAE